MVVGPAECDASCDWPRKAEFILHELEQSRMRQDRIEATLDRMRETLESLREQIHRASDVAAKDRSTLWQRLSVVETKTLGIVGLVGFLGSIVGGVVLVAVQHFMPT